MNKLRARAASAPTDRALIFVTRGELTALLALAERVAELERMLREADAVIALYGNCPRDLEHQRHFNDAQKRHTSRARQQAAGETRDASPGLEALGRTLNRAQQYRESLPSGVMELIAQLTSLADEIDDGRIRNHLYRAVDAIEWFCRRAAKAVAAGEKDDA